MLLHNLSWDQVHIASAREQRPATYQLLTALAPVVMVGLTGVGKTTVINQLRTHHVPFTLLPNRREVADKVIIASLQAEDGEVPHPVGDRLARFEYTARYRSRYPGGMAHAVSQLAIDPAGIEPILIFDGLRGLDEVKLATDYFSRARFVVLDAPDTVRLARLLRRNDAFDTANSQPAPVDQNLLSTLKNIPEIGSVFDREQLLQIAAMSGHDQFSVEDLLQKVSIIVKERRNYDSEAAATYLRRHWPAERVLIIDTAARPGEVVARRVANWLKD